MPEDHEILTHTFAVQYSPNCPSPWLIRMAGKWHVIDLKPYAFYTLPEDRTKDILGFGKTFDEAAQSALSQLKLEAA